MKDGNGGGWVSGWDGEAAPATRHACLKLDSLLTAASLQGMAIKMVRVSDQTS